MLTSIGTVAPATAAAAARRTSPLETKETMSAPTNDNGALPVKDSDMVVMKPDKIGDADFANYFCTYGYLYHQKDMLEDQQRMTAYHDAVRLNPALFRGSLVALG